MTITIELQPDIENYAKKQASQSGLPLEDYIVSIIKEAVSQHESNGTDITMRLDEIYAAQSSGLDVNLQKMQAASLPPEEW